MSGKLSDLNNHLFAQLDRLGVVDITKDGLDLEIQRTNSIVFISEQVINNAKVQLDAAKLVATHGVGQWEKMLPEVEGKPNPPQLMDFSDKKDKK